LSSREELLQKYCMVLNYLMSDVQIYTAKVNLWRSNYRVRSPVLERFRVHEFLKLNEERRRSYPNSITQGMTLLVVFIP
jgi:hypothetical protein